MRLQFIITLFPCRQKWPCLQWFNILTLSIQILNLWCQWISFKIIILRWCIKCHSLMSIHPLSSIKISEINRVIQLWKQTKFFMTSTERTLTLKSSIKGQGPISLLIWLVLTLSTSMLRYWTFKWKSIKLRKWLRSQRTGHCLRKPTSLISLVKVTLSFKNILTWRSKNVSESLWSSRLMRNREWEVKTREIEIDQRLSYWRLLITSAKDLLVLFRTISIS